MTKNNEIQSKILIFEHNRDCDESLRAFCNENALISLKPGDSRFSDALKNNTDLGAIMISSATTTENMSCIDLAQTIHDERPELPIFIRVEDLKEGISILKNHSFISEIFTLDTLDRLKAGLNKHLFSTFYPVPLIRAFNEVTEKAIHSIIKDCSIAFDAPFLVRDQVIFGELFSLIPLESNWYRGYMMIQTTQNATLDLIANEKTALTGEFLNFRAVNALLNEITNLIWGGINSQFNDLSTSNDASLSTRIQVPIIVNHQNKYICFGTNEPHLCFSYRIIDNKNQYPPVHIVQKFIFNLSWYPENFQECSTKTDNMVNSGELELF